MEGQDARFFFGAGKVRGLSDGRDTAMMMPGCGMTEGAGGERTCMLRKEGCPEVRDRTCEELCLGRGTSVTALRIVITLNLTAS